jgi:polysaccharide export outer membrane protein
MTRCSTTLLIKAILMTCSLAGAQAGQVSQTGSSPSDTTGKSPQASSPDVQFQQRDPRYRLQKSDVIEVKFKFSPEFDQAITVQPDGFITLDGAGDIRVEDKTIPELKEAIRRAYQGILREPVITVSLKDFDKPFFIAAGQVGHPGKYELRSDTTLVEALAIAGDITTAAKHSQVVLFRHISRETVEARVFNVKRMLASHNLEEDPHLLPGDLVFVPQNKISKMQRYLPTTNLGSYISPTQF